MSISAYNEAEALYEFDGQGKCKAVQCTAQQISGGAGAFGEQRASRKRTAVEIQTVHRRCV